jgi:HicB family
MKNEGVLMSSVAERAEQVVEQAAALARQAKSWTEFSNQLFAQEHGLVARAFPRMTERQAFYDTQQYETLNAMLLELMKRFGIADGAAPKKSGKFVLRVPKTLHASLEVEAKDEGVSLNQLATTKLAIRLKDSTDITKSLVVEAFKKVFDGYSSDRIIVDPPFNARYLEECRALGLGQSDYELNHILYDIRKGGGSVLPPATKKPKITDYDEFLFASEIAFRHLQRREGVTLDRVLCDPELRKRFDEIALRLCNEESVFKLRMGALYLRKTHRLSPGSGTAFDYDLRPAGQVSQLKLADVPELPGMYAFFDNTRPIFASETGKLRHRIGLHLRSADKLFLPRWLELGCEVDLELRFFTQTRITTKDRLGWLNHFINKERPPLNYQAAA